MARSERGIFCIECQELSFDASGLRKTPKPFTDLVLGTSRLTNGTSAAVLGILSKELQIPILSCRVGTWIGLTQVIEEWAISKRSLFPVLWLAGRRIGGFQVLRDLADPARTALCPTARYLDGRPGGKPTRTVSVDALTQIASESAAQEYAAEDVSAPSLFFVAKPWSGCIVHFSATLRGKRQGVYDLLETSGLSAVSGYGSIRGSDWVPTVAFEALYIKFLKEALDRSAPSGFGEDDVDWLRQRILDSRMCLGLIEHLGFQII